MLLQQHILHHLCFLRKRLESPKQALPVIFNLYVCGGCFKSSANLGIESGLN